MWRYLVQAGQSNPVWSRADKAASLTLSNGELTATGNSTNNWYAVRGGKAMARGKWYWEVLVLNASDVILGIMSSSGALSTGYPGFDAYGYGYYSATGNKYNGGSNSAYGNTFAAGDIVSVAFDATGGAIYFYKNGAIQNSGTAAYTGITGTYYPSVGCYNTGSVTANFGDKPFVYSVPDGYNSGVY